MYQNFASSIGIEGQKTYVTKQKKTFPPMEYYESLPTYLAVYAGDSK